MTETDYSAERAIGSLISTLGEAIEAELCLLDIESCDSFAKRLISLAETLQQPESITANSGGISALFEPEPHENQEILLKIFLSLANLQQDILRHADQIHADDMRNIRERTEQFLVFVSENEEEKKQHDG